VKSTVSTLLLFLLHFLNNIGELSFNLLTLIRFAFGETAFARPIVSELTWLSLTRGIQEG